MQRRHRRAHRRVWIVLALLLPLLLLGALALRQGDPREAAPVRLAEPPS
jgi:hypothetical protein